MTDREHPLIAAFRRYVPYVLSLPERTLRAMAAVVSGATTLLSENVFPPSLRGTTTYRVTIGMAQQFMMERVAGIQRETGRNPLQVGDDYMQRKMAGTALEAAGLVAVGFSPMWVLAIAGDVAGGSKTYLRRLVKRLKETGVIAPDAEANSLADLLEAVQDATRQGATAIDMPPLSRPEITKLADGLSASYLRIFDGTANLLPKLDDIWERMMRLAKRENVPIEQVGGMLTLEIATRRKRNPAGAIAAAGSVGIELVDDHILDSYRQTLASIGELGLDRYAGEHLRPFMQSAREHFDAQRLTWTEKQLAGKKGNAGEDSQDGSASTNRA